MTTKKKLNPDEVIDGDILDLIGASGMSDEQKDRVYKKMMETIETRVMARVDDLLSDLEATEIKLFIETNDRERFESYLLEKNIDIAKIYAEESLFYKVELVELIKGQEA